MAEPSLFSEDEAGGPPTLTVGELAARIARLTASAFPGDLWVEGQIRNLSRSANGHAYFDLAEPTAAGEQPRAQVSVTLLAPERKLVNAQLKRVGGAVRMDDGIEVRIQGRLRWYAPRGTLQLKMHGIDPAFTLGRLQADRDRILAGLLADGLLDANRARPLTLVPLRVGLVTSVGSAAHADVLAEFAASGLGFTIRTVDARTQGPDSARSVVHGLHRLAGDGVDVILLVRGGGARTDLAGFDTDLIARAVAAMPVPVFTGIGHEVDRSIADDVAHSAHKTPTAAAAAVIALVRAFLDRVDERWDQARRAAGASAAVADARLDRRA
ncbi:MAG: xseA, partial [Acidimicrobiales bacterium]|nr:xseA [Acidimicrobiales bacterium]